MEIPLIKNCIFSILLIVSVLFGQDNTKLGIDEKTGKPILLGECSREAFNDSNFVWWFNSGYKFYTTDSSVVRKINWFDLDSVTAILVIGTWCSDSRREVPRFFKVIDDIQFPKEKIKIIGVDRNKSSSGTEIQSLNIELVPTFIFYKNENEIGRIIETPEISIESDMLKILRGD